MTPRRPSRSRSRNGRLRRVRLALDLPLAVVAARSGFSASYISAVERGARPTTPAVTDCLWAVYGREIERTFRGAA